MPQLNGAPPTEIHIVKDAYFGAPVEDPYRWLEADSPETKAWTAAQNAFAHATLDPLADREVFRGELDKIFNAPLTQHTDFKVANAKLFARRKQPNKEQDEIVVLTDLEHPKTAKLIFAPISADHPHRSIDWFVPSPDGTKLAIAVSDGGSEAADLHVVDLAGKELEVLPNVSRATAGGDAAWAADSKGLYYTRYPQPGEPHADEPDLWLQVFFHPLATPVAKDRHELGSDLPKNSEIMLDSDSRGRVIASVQLGDGGQFRHYLRDKTGWRQLDDWGDKIVAIAFGTTPELWVVSRKDAPRGKLLKLAATAKTAAEAVLVVPEGKHAIITQFNYEELPVAIGDRVYVRYQLGGPSELLAFSSSGKPAQGPVGPPVSTASKPVEWRGDVLVEFGSYITPQTWMRYAPKTDKLVELVELSPRPPVDFSTLEVRRETATSKDGTAVPLNIIWPKGAALDGTTPCIVTGYGGFGISEEPAEWRGYAPLLARRFCLVDVNLRGGGEFGEDWHRNGMLAKKQNVFDDFAAALDYVVAKHYTSRGHLAISGASNGGLLMGAMITQHPDAMKAVISEVGLYDMLRSELTPNGAFNTAEYGTVTDAAQWKALFAYSPYHHVTRGVAYPAILMQTGDNDTRVTPWQSRKMIAALQAANSGSAPILLETSATAGHGIGTNMSERIEMLATRLAFLAVQLR